MGKNKNKRKKKNQVSGGGFHNVDLENRNSEDKNLKDKSNDKKKKKHEKKEKDEKKTKKTTNEPEEINNYQNNSDDCSILINIILLDYLYLKLAFDYDEDQIPPDWTIAEEHFVKQFQLKNNICILIKKLARRSAPEREDENLEVKNRHCKCCGYIVEREEVPLNIDYRQLGFLGVGFPLFFYYIISCIYVLLIIFCISAIFNLATNNYSEDCFSQSEVDLLVIAANAANNTLLAEYYSDKECVLAWATRLSIGNKRDHIAYLTAQRWLNLVTIVVLIIYFQIMRRNQRKIEKVCDESLATPSDYAVMVTDIKKNLGIDYDDELKVFFEQNAIPGKKANIGFLIFFYIYLSLGLS